MRKLAALILAMTMVFSMAVVASAENTTKLTTTVPAAVYTLNIPADQEVTFGALSTDIGNVTVTGASGFAEGKNLKVTLSYGDFTCPNVSTTIPLHIDAYAKFTLGTAENHYPISTGSSLSFLGEYGGSVTEKAIFIEPTNNRYAVQSLSLDIPSEAWGKALAGQYTATITFSSEVVVE